MQESAACKSCLRITLEENGEVKCQASDHSIVCKIALNSMSAVDVKTKDAEHSFVTWWGSMCCSGAWGQEVHQTSHAASRLKLVTLFIIGRGILFPQGPVPKCPHRDEPSEKKIYRTSASAWQGLHTSYTTRMKEWLKKHFYRSSLHESQRICVRYVSDVTVIQ